MSTPDWTCRGSRVVTSPGMGKPSVWSAASVSPPPPLLLPPQARATIPAAAATARTLSRIGFINPPFLRLFQTSLTWLPSLFVLGDNTYLVSACPPGGGHPAIEPWPESAGAGKVWQVPGQ